MLVSIRILVISSRKLIRAGLVSLLLGQPQIKEVGEVDDPNFDAANFDVGLWDVGDHKPQNVPFRFVTFLHDANAARAWLDAGAAGIVFETAPLEELLDALRQVARGETYLPASITTQIASSSEPNTLVSQLIEPLTEREREVVILIAQGLSNKDIAQKLYLSVRTVEGHLANIYGKLQVKSRTEAAIWAMRHLSLNR